jgi:site-specific DNA-cytosine methylase
MGYHHSEPRSLTNRERARLQSFPDTFLFDGSIREVRAQIGNAVAPVAAHILVGSVVDALREAGVSPQHGAPRRNRAALAVGDAAA